MNSSALFRADLTLEERVGARDYPSSVLDVIKAVCNARSETDVLELMYRARDVLGVEQAVFASFIRDDQTHESFRILLAASAQWCLNYRAEEDWSNDAWLLYASTHSEPALDSEIRYRSRGQLAKRDLARHHGLASAFVVPAPSSAGLSRLGVLVLGSSQADYFRGGNFVVFKALCRSLAMELGEWWIRTIRRELIEHHRVSPDDLELLRRERCGQSTKQIASELGLPEATVNNRFQRLNAKFDSPNRRATANQAAEYGMI